jgi:hypothetical protein
VEPGHIFKRKAGTKMATVSSDPTDVIKQLDYVEAERTDKDGNTVTVRVY